MMRIISNFILLAFSDLIDAIVGRIASLLSGEHRQIREEIDALCSRLDAVEKEVEKVLTWCEGLK